MATVGGIIFICETPKSLCELENATRTYIDKVAKT